MRNKKQIIRYLDFQEEYKLRGNVYMKAFQRVLRSGRYVLGPEVEKFEKGFSNYLDARYCIGVGNGLEALQISLMALGIRSDDEIITTPLSAVATTLAILSVGAVPIFVDVKENGQIDENLIEDSITKKTKAVLPVHIYGQPCNIERIRRICREHKLFLIEDAAQAHGSTLNNKKLGTFGDTGCFSFYPTKNLGAIGDGGAIVTNNSKIARMCRELRDYGQESKYKHVKYGLNSRLDELQAAILIEKLKFLDKDNEKRRLLAARYVRNLKNIEELRTVLPNKLSDSNFHLFVIKTKKRNQLREYLNNKGIGALVHYPITIPDQPLFKKKYRDPPTPVARKFVKRILSLPCNPYLTFSQVDRVSNSILEFFEA